MGPLFTLLTTAIAPEVASLVHAELASGSPIDTAVKTVIGNLEAKITNPTVHAATVGVLNALVSVVESFGTPSTASTTAQ